MTEISEKQLVAFRDIIWKACGLWFGDSKLSILGNRIRSRMAETGIIDPEQYRRAISSEDDRAELSTLINIVTTNETYFYRSESQIDCFRNFILPQLADKKIAAGDRTMRIWSAGCSTGEEPYTIAMALMESIRFHSIWNFQIYATDISTAVLEKAMEGVYSKRAVERLPKELLDKYFTFKDGKYIINNVVKKMVEFDYANLFDSYYMAGFDIIFCRNVLIYFRDEDKKSILERFHASLVDDGWLFLGPTEMIRGLVDGFKLTPMKDCVIFQKQPG